MILILLKIFIFSFLINLLWEVLHSQLYETCLKASLKKYIPLITFASLKDGFWITLFYYISTILFNNQNILLNQSQLLFYIIISLIFAFIVEVYAINHRRWEYSNKMQKFLGVGLTPLFELTINTPNSPQ